MIMVLTRYYKYGPLNTHDVVKCVAIVLMIIDHIGAYLLPEHSDFRLIGRFAMPLFLFLVGYSLSYRWRWDLFFWACAVLAGGLLLGQPVFSLNILFAILLTRVLMRWLDKNGYIYSHPWHIIVASVIWYFPLAPLLDYSVMNALFAVSGYLVAKDMRATLTRIFLCITLALHVLVQMIDFEFSVYQCAVYIALTPPMGLFMLHYRLKTYQGAVAAIAAPIKFIGRYSLEIYALHLLLFFALARWLFPAKYMGFSWF